MRAHRDGSDIERIEEIGHRYRTARGRSNRLRRAFRNASWARKMANTAASLLSRDRKQACAFLSSLRLGQRTRGVCAVQHADGRTATSDRDLLDALSDHFGNLFRDDKGHSRDAAHWQGMAVRRHAPLPGQDERIEWRELCHALKSTGNTAPGLSQITNGMLRQAWSPPPENGTDVDAPTNPLGKALFKLVTCIWDRGVVPSGWRDSVLVALHKKGDPTVLDNYRGITLIECALKLVCSVSARRLATALEAEGRLSMQQGGFRRGRECAGQYVALYEVCRARLADSKRTYVAFLDLAKAFDKVPTEALLMKLEAVGCHGRNLAFIRALYRSARVAVRNRGVLGRWDDVMVGVRQGCPLSPILFAIFIDDLPDRVERFGVRLEANPRRLASLLFADDTVLLSPSRAALSESLERTFEWGQTWGMEFGIPKCGVMGIGPRAHARVTRSARTFKLGASLIPVVGQYVYLGVAFAHTLSLAKMAATVRGRVTKASDGLLHILRSKALPVSAALELIRLFVRSTCTYASELLAQDARWTGGINAALERCVKAAYKFGPRQPVASGVLTTDSELSPIRADWQRNRIRLFEKYAQSELQGTWLHRLMRLHAFQAAGSFAKLTRGTCARIVRSMAHMGATVPTGSKVAQYYTDMWRRGMESEERQLRLCASGTTRIWWPTRAWLSVLAQVDCDPTAAERVFLRVRHGMYPTCARMAAKGLVRFRGARACPVCGSSEAESIGHLIRRCPAWDVARAQYLGVFAGWLNSAADDDTVVAVLTGVAPWILGNDWLASAPWLPGRTFVSFWDDRLAHLNQIDREALPAPAIAGGAGWFERGIHPRADVSKAMFVRGSASIRDKLAAQMRCLPLLRFMSAIGQRRWIRIRMYGNLEFVQLPRAEAQVGYGSRSSRQGAGSE